MNIIATLINSYKKSRESERQKKARTNFLKNRELRYPKCTLSANCNIIKTELGKQVVVHGNAILRSSIVGNHTYFASNSIISFSNIGNFCSFGERVKIGLPRHPTKKFISTYPAFFSLNNDGCLESFVSNKKYGDLPRQTNIGNDVWIGEGVIIPGGISIGTGAIIAAGSVVIKDVPPYGIVGGNPASLIRYRFSEEDVHFLLKTAWWNLSEEQIAKFAENFDDMTTFQKKIIEILKNNPN